MSATRLSLSLALLLHVAHGGVAAAEQRTEGRLAPPSSVTCARNQLTVYAGKAVAWRQFEDHSELTVSTDWGTTEKVTIPGSADDQLKSYLLHGGTFQVPHKQRVFDKSRQLQANVRVNAWVCADKAVPPVLDWQPPR